MPTDPIPHDDDGFDDVVNIFAPWLALHGAAHGVSVGDLAAIASGTTDWTGKFAAHKLAQTAAMVGTVGKNGSRATLEPLLRAAANKITDQGERATAGLNTYAERRGRVPAPTTRPILMVDTSQRLQHTIRIADENTPDSRKKPDGVVRWELWCYIGVNPPSAPGECTLMESPQQPSFVMHHEGENANKSIHYMARWVNSRGEKGPWSETVSATITA